MRTSSVCCFSRSVPSAGGSRTTRANSSTAVGAVAQHQQRIGLSENGTPGKIAARHIIPETGTAAGQKAKGKGQKAKGKRYEARGAALSPAAFSFFHCPLSLVKHRDPPNS